MKKEDALSYLAGDMLFSLSVHTDNKTSASACDSVLDLYAYTRVRNRFV